MNETEFIEPIETIAIVGMSGRFPGAANVNEFWENLKNGKESVSFFSEEELRESGVESRQLSNPNYVKAKAFVEDIDKFDAAFFGYSPREAALMDPQHRFFLESAWEALEDGGCNPEKYDGAIGLFAGVSLNSYLMLNLLSDSDLLHNDGILQTSLPNRTDHLTTRVAYKLNLKGPAVTIQTACSTSLVAVHLACQSLLNYQSDLALAGGVTIGVPNKSGYMFQEGGVLSPDGHCRAFDASANGTTVGNGVGIVLLKRLSEALEDGDRIYAVIKGSAINNDGANKVGFTAPSVEGQIEVITTALQVADVEADSISYIETHGTGTSLGDPIEMQALSSAFRHGKNKSCALGSVKTNVGHLDVAAGVTGLIKTVLALKNKQIPPSLNFSQPNPHIDFENSGFYVNTELKDWERNGVPRRAGVSSFGIGGTNAHVVLEEFQPENKAVNGKPYHLILLSAQTQGALEKATSNLSDFLKTTENPDMANVAYTLQTGRKHFKYRRSFACADREEALFLLEKLDPKKVSTGLQEPKPRPVVFMFTGQGAQYAGMGAELYKNEKVFRETLDHCASYLEPKLNVDIRELLFAGDEMREAADAQLSRTQLTQPALFIIEYALAKQLEHWNIKPDEMIGHSIGEYVAACLAGVFTLEDCLDLVALRGRLMQSVEKGSMLSVSLSEEEILPYLNEELSLSAVNSPNLCVVGGTDAEIEKLRDRLNEDAVDCRILKTSHAFHSKMMEPILDAFKEAVANVKRAKPALSFVSNVTGKRITEDEAVSPQYWANHLRNTVRFSEGIVNFFDDPDTILLEVGPGQTLMTIARWHPQKGTGQKVLTTLPQPNERGKDLDFLLGAIGRLWLLGIEPDWNNLNESEKPQKISLPTYPFDKQSYWINPRRQSGKFQSDEDLLKKKEDLSDWLYVASWYRTATARHLTNQKPEGKTILCFVPENLAGEQISDELAENGANIIKIFTGEHFSAQTDGNYRVNPDSKEDFTWLLQDLSKKGVSFSTILYGWAITSAGDGSELNTGINFYAPLYLIQTLGEINPSESVEMIFVTNEMNPVTGAENISPSKSLLLSFGKVAPMEYPDLKIRNLDFSLENAGEEFSRNDLNALINEVSGDYDEKIVAYRHGYRWLQKFEAQKMPPPLIDRSRLKQNGVYLITGGLGGVGLTLAKYLAESVKASLILVGRTPFPARDEWTNILSGSADNKFVKQIEKIIELENLGGRVLPVSANIADLESMTKAIDAAVEQFGHIDGVVHCAGIPAGGMIQLKEKSVVDAVFEPKVQGTTVIERLFHDKHLDFLAICSSRNAIIGGFGQIDYCAANNFCDAFAYYYAKRYDTFAVSVNWDAWQEVGMLVDTAASYGVRENGNLNGNSGETKKAAKPAVHPLLGSVLDETADAVSFISEHNINTQWVLDEHRIGSNPVIPGVTYLEMARAAMEYKEGETPIKISEVYFITPVSMKDDEARFLKFSMEKENGVYNFTVLSCKDDYEDENTEWRDHIVGKVEVVQEENAAQHDLKEIINKCSFEQLSSDQHELDPDLGARWQNIKKAFLGKDEYLVHFELSSEFADDLKTYKLHPSLLDRAAGTGMLYLDLDAVYLPFSYKNLLYRKPLTESIYAHIIQTEPYKKGMETVTFDVIITDDAGDELVRIEEFSEKRINDLSEKIKTIAKEGSTIARKTAPEKNGSNFYAESLQEGISPHEGADVFGRILTHFELPQIIVSTRDLNASIEKANNFTQEAVALEIEKINKTNAILQPRPSIATEYIAPRNKTEEKLAAIMSELLGISEIGVEDNFFELGGDSVLGIQIIAKAKKVGMQITPQQVFQHPTIAELASIVSESSAVEEPETFTSEFELVDFDASELDSIASMIAQEN